MTDSLNGRVAVVTGGGNGIGAAVARRLAGRGADVVVVDRDAAAARSVATAIGGTAVKADLATPEGTRTAFARAQAVYGRIDLLHLNAGVLSGEPDIARLDIERYRTTTGVNMDAVVFGVQAALPALESSGNGAILVTSSVAGLTPFELDPVYAMTKHAVIGLVRALAAPLEHRGVRIGALCPDFVDTAFFGLHRDMLVASGLEMLAAGTVADAAVAELTGGKPGTVLVVRAGREPYPHSFAEVY